MAHSLRALGAALLGFVSPLVMAAGLDMHKDPHCGCCSAWADHVRAAGFEVSVLEEADMGAVKRELGVPRALASCHTAVLTTDAGQHYLIEGHVPAEQLTWLQQASPDIDGLAVPGMPHGSPGMETGRVDDYAVLSFTAGEDRAKVVARYP
ncbi:MULTISPECIES: DUF411 domain-containing protein [Halomonas]|uniref:DUF411 domain-containing protein n=1 Tax=Halomonas TaxID=2745 RepID=UPI001C94F2A7|nr:MULTISPECIES: DUF411 domain-containing protein [Halomonas]MBY6207395.1 DUF411 domain-containing protein [Halomonas sp. DP3Y7-2]MBY6228204.1 DUF411 domain-containing protein [Halomonas sp. DP3Y7-1]MCA0916270.1 DUF411 domain-containing protein [Halomonas denitrificans]